MANEDQIKIANDRAVKGIGEYSYMSLKYSFLFATQSLSVDWLLS